MAWAMGWVEAVAAIAAPLTPFSERPIGQIADVPEPPDYCRPAEAARIIAPMTHTYDDSVENQDPLRLCLLEMAAMGPVSPEQVARNFAEQRRRPKDPADLWRRYFAPVKQQALALARAGRLEFVRKGEVVDPERVRGLVKYRLASGTETPPADPPA